MKRRGYAIVLVLAMLLISSLAGSFFLKRGDQRLEISQLNLNERSLRIKIASDFNRLSQEFSLFIEQRLSAANPDDPKNLLDDYLCQTDNPTAPCFDVADFLAEGIQSVIVRCRGQNEGTDFQSRTCLDDQVFPKTFFMEVQIRSLEKRDVSLLASGEIMFAPTPLNTFARAKSAISSSSRILEATYSGNVALGFCSDEAKIYLRPSANKTLAFSAPIVTNQMNQLVFDTSAPGAKINYPGVKELPGLGGMLSAFQMGMNRAMGEETNRVYDVREELLDPGIDLPAELELVCTLQGGLPRDDSLPYSLEVGCQLQEDSVPRFWLTSGQFQARASRSCSGTATVEVSQNQCRNLQFPADDSFVAQLGLWGWQVSCQQESVAGAEGDPLWRWTCNFSRPPHERTLYRSIGVGGIQSNIFVFSQMPEVIFDQVGSSPNTATANEAFAIYVPDGRVNLMRPFDWTGNDNRLGGSFFARDGFFLSRDTRGDNAGFLNGESSNFTFEATLVALEGPQFDNVRLWDPTTEDFPVENTDKIVVTQATGFVNDGDVFQPARIDFCEGEQFQFFSEINKWVKLRRPATINMGDLLDEPYQKLGKLYLKGGLVSPELSQLRRFNSNNQLIAGFQDVESVFLPNDSPPLIQRVFVSDLMTTVLNLNIHISDPRAAMDEVGLTWEAPQPDD